MTEQKIGAQLDALGLVIDMEEGERVAEAVVTVTTHWGDGGLMRHSPVHAPRPRPKPVPYPVQRRIVTVIEAGQVLSEAQKQRVRSWLEANSIDPQFVFTGAPITVHSRVVNHNEGACQIRYTEYCRDENGQRFTDAPTEGLVTVERRVRQAVPLDEDPEVTL
ncbi:hypothetical protein AB0K62_13840 [Streptomyces halstedii]|uniref:hypothetical protein n=1 Tax=Streptomyces halstedii TaxID=1944 RepID=UPI0034604B31